jgi:hypothetical protein
MTAQKLIFVLKIKYDDCMTPNDHLVLASMTNKMQRYTISFIAVNALRVLGGFSAHHQEPKFKTVPTASGMC